MNASGPALPILLAAASTLAAPLMPVTVACFLVLLNKPAYMGEARPRGPMRLFWNAVLSVAVLILTINAYFALQTNWTKLQGLLSSGGETTTTAAPVPGPGR